MTRGWRAAAAGLLATVCATVRAAAWAAVWAAVWAGPAAADAPSVNRASFDYGLRARALAPGVYVVEGANADFSIANGCNIINTGFIVTGAGVVVVNTGPSKRYGEQLRALIGRTTAEPVVQVFNLNLHPDYIFGNQAFADVPRMATPSTRAGIQREGKAYEDNLYRLCGDWMRGSELRPPSADLQPGVQRIGSRDIELRELQGHTASDTVLVDRSSGIVFAGGLVFAQRVPTTPHAQLPAWQTSLQVLQTLNASVLVPSHGPVATDAAAVDAAISGTRRYLAWLDAAFRDAAAHGLEMNEVLRLPVPTGFKAWAAFDSEYTRNVAHLYPRYEQATLAHRP
jgi:quinoprotein relay system zinc metallohydrolase 1